ncbi:MAG: type III pantothenate kinase [Dorea sp.]|jgi:type III pantothenate kinase|nr:type III pantothenate kinase [Dorea sp.]
MLLVIDVGNTNITVGVFRDKELRCTFRMTTKLPRTSDEYGITLKELVECQGIMSNEIHAVIVSSVVPDIMHSLGSAIIKYFGIKPMVVSAGIKTGIRIVTENPKQVGADRIVDAVAAYTLYGGPVIVIDFGTATTYDVVGPDGTFEGAVISPGIRISSHAMTEQAAMLPAIEIKKPEGVIGKETISCMQAGLFFGQIGQTEYLVKKIKEESGYTDAKVIASGGLGKMIAAETDVIDVYDPQLTLKGLRFIYEKNKKQRSADQIQK